MKLSLAPRKFFIRVEGREIRGVPYFARLQCNLPWGREVLFADGGTVICRWKEGRALLNEREGQFFRRHRVPGLLKSDFRFETDHLRIS